MNILGFSVALLSMFLFGLYIVPRKLNSLRDYDFVLSMCIGAVITTQIARLVVNGPSVGDTSTVGLALSFACGPIWSLGILFYTLSVSQMGLTLATPIKNTTAVLGTLLGLLVFAEWRDTNAALALIGSVLVVTCAVILSRTSDRTCERSCINPLGTVFALLAAVFFAAYTVPLKLAQKSGLDSTTIMAWMGVGTLLGGLVLFLVFSRNRRRWLRESPRDHLFAALAGCIWALATISMSEAIRLIGLSITWPVTNLNTIVTVAAGIFLFREIDAARHRRTIAVAMACAMVGSALLGLAK